MAADPQRNDGLVNVRCPYCPQLWYRMQPGPPDGLHEIKCIRCKRIIMYRVDHGRVEDQAAARL